MSVCTYQCPGLLPPEKLGGTGRPPQQELDRERAFLEMLNESPDWSLLSLVDLVNAGNTLEDIPFRVQPCSRSLRCCGSCSRRCYNRCLQDCLHRLYMWKKLYENTPENERSNLPLNVRMIVKQKFTTREDLSWVVGDILSRSTNSKLDDFMTASKLYTYQNPYKVDYAPTPQIDPETGKRMVELGTGKIKYLEWPLSGLCPYCKPDVTVDLRYMKERNNLGKLKERRHRNGL